MALQGLAYFPGIQQIVSATYTLSHGITPGRCVMEIAPQGSFVATDGALRFLFGNVHLVFPGCKVVRSSIRRNQAGQVVGLQIADRRWKWANGHISGQYNQILPDLADKSVPAFDIWQRKSARQLAELLLAAMGELKYDVSAIPADAYPPVDWDYTNPAKALADLADTFGCHVVLKGNNSVQLARVGVGANLPTGGEMEDSAGIELPETPDSLLVACGLTLYQADILLEPVGLDVDGKIKKIDDLSYKPSDGWGPVHTDFDGLPAANPQLQEPVALGVTEPESPRDLARRTVWRWYRPFITPGWPLDVPGYPKQLTNVREIQLTDRQNKTVEVDGEIDQLEPIIEGYYNRDSWTTESFYGQYTRPFRILADKNVVEFDQPVFQWDDTPDKTENLRRITAQLYLRTAFHIRDLTTGAWIRHTQLLQIPGAKWNAGTRVLHHDELVLMYDPIYDTTGNVTELLTNKNKIDPAINYYLQSALAEFQVPQQREVQYAGLLPIEVDGAIQQVTWMVGLSGAMTRASRNSEHSLTRATYEERRMWERMRNPAFPPSRAQRTGRSRVIANQARTNLFG